MATVLVARPRVRFAVAVVVVLLCASQAGCSELTARTLVVPDAHLVIVPPRYGTQYVSEQVAGVLIQLGFEPQQTLASPDHTAPAARAQTHQDGEFAGTRYQSKDMGSLQAYLKTDDLSGKANVWFVEDGRRGLSEEAMVIYHAVKEQLELLFGADRVR